jgi:hypothetical protein
MHSGKISLMGAVLIGMAWDASAPPVKAGSIEPLRVRRDQMDLSPADKQLFVDAMKDMKAAKPLGDGTNATNRYDEFVFQHRSDCEHHDSGPAADQ